MNGVASRHCVGMTSACACRQHQSHLWRRARQTSGPLSSPTVHNIPAAQRLQPADRVHCARQCCVRHRDVACAFQRFAAAAHLACGILQGSVPRSETHSAYLPQKRPSSTSSAFQPCLSTSIGSGTTREATLVSSFLQLAAFCESCARSVRPRLLGMCREVAPIPGEAL